MGRLGVVLAAAIGLLACAGPAGAETSPRILRVLGETTSPPEGMPARFVIDATLEAGDDPFKAELDGWMAALEPDPKGDEIEGTCVEARCALSMTFGDNKLAISADLAGPAPGTGRVVLTDGDGKTIGQAQVRFSAITGPVAGLGELARPDAIRSLELADLLMWNGSPTGFSNVGDEPVDWMERGSVAEWQAASERPGAGLILVDDLATLRRQADAAKAAIGWTPIKGPGWSAGYPAALLPNAEKTPNGQRYSSADGKLVLLIAVDPPMSDDAWDAYVDKATEDAPGIDRRGYTRVNNDMEINWVEKKRLTAAAYHKRPAGLLRLEYSAPEDGGPAEPDLATLLPRSFHAEDGEP